MSKVKVYSTPTCPYCNMAKDFLKQNKVSFEEVDVSKDQTKPAPIGAGFVLSAGGHNDRQKSGQNQKPRSNGERSLSCPGSFQGFSLLVYFYHTDKEKGHKNKWL